MRIKAQGPLQILMRHRSWIDLHNQPMKPRYVHGKASRTERNVVGETEPELKTTTAAILFVCGWQFVAVL